MPFFTYQNGKEKGCQGGGHQALPHVVNKGRNCNLFGGQFSQNEN